MIYIEKNEKKAKIAVLGVGRMGSAIIKCFLECNAYSSDQILGTHHNYLKASELSRGLGIDMSTSNDEVVARSNTIYICVRPQQVPNLIDEIREHINKHQIVVSIAVGVPLEWLRYKLPKCRSIYHIHPSSMLMAEMPWISSVACEQDDNGGGLEEIKRAFNGLGGVKIIPENMMEKWAVLVGCAPAIFARMAIEWQMISNYCNLPENEAKQLRNALFEVIGGSALRGNLELEKIVERIATPGGVTEEGLRALDSEGIGEVFSNVVEASLGKIKRIKDLFQESLVDNLT